MSPTNEHPDPSRNATTHGLTSRRPIHEVESERMKVMYDDWITKMFPETPAEEALVSTAAIEYVRYIRCVKAEEARLRPAGAEAVKQWKEARQHAIRRKAQDLKTDPEGTVAALRESAFGIDWMTRHWRNLLAMIDSGRGWLGTDLVTAMGLLGRLPMKPNANDAEARDLWELAYRACPSAFDAKAPQGMSPDAEAVEQLRAFLLDQVGRLDTLRPIVWDEVDGPEAEAVEVAAMVDTSKEGQLRHRYRRDAYRDYRSSLAELNRLRSERSKTHAREAKLMADASPSRPPAFVPPPKPLAPVAEGGSFADSVGGRTAPGASSCSPVNSPNEPSTPAEFPPDSRLNPRTENELRNSPSDRSCAPDQRTEGRTEGRTGGRTEPLTIASDTLDFPIIPPSASSNSPGDPSSPR